MRKFVIAVVVAAILVLGGWSAYNFTKSKPSTPTNTVSSPSTNNSSNSSQAAASKVNIVNMLFTPSQVTINKGETVTWTNNDSTTHTVVADNGKGPNSGDIAPGASYSYTFNDTGSYQYHCSIHSAMHGTIVVR